MESYSYEIGRTLQEAREQAGLEVVDVIYQARIPKSVIEALEAEDFSFFSSPTYAKSFLRQYSQFLEVDADEWLSALQPGSFVAGQVLGLMDAGEAAPVKKQAEVASMGGLSTMWLLVLSGGLVYGGLEAYKFLEKKLEENPVAAPESPQAVLDKSAEPAIKVEPGPEKTPEVERGYVVSGETDTVPRETVPVVAAPRAIIVRE